MSGWLSTRDAQTQGGLHPNVENQTNSYHHESESVLQTRATYVRIASDERQAHDTALNPNGKPPPLRSRIFGHTEFALVMSECPHCPNTMAAFARVIEKPANASL
jgi:hypothetical protein